MTKNLNCPFCGEIPFIHNNKLSCANPKCRISGLQFTQEYWNTRPDPLQAKISEYRKYLTEHRSPINPARVEFERIFGKDEK
jgi:hypothetical protein